MVCVCVCVCVWLLSPWRGEKMRWLGAVGEEEDEEGVVVVARGGGVVICIGAASVCWVDGTSYVTGALVMKGMTSVTTPMSLGILFFSHYVFFCKWMSCLQVVGVAEGVVCLHNWWRWSAKAVGFFVGVSFFYAG